MTPIFLISDLSKLDYDEPIIAVSNCSDAFNNNYTCISPTKKLGEVGLILWTIKNGFRLFEDMDAIAITNKAISKYHIAQFEYIIKKEFTNSIGYVSLASYEDGIGKFYSQTDKINLDSFLIHKNAYTRIKHMLTDDIIFNDELSKEYALAMLKNAGMNSFEIYDSYEAKRNHFI